MTYGRLDVFWPDGKFETYLLESPTVSVGRSNGCTIVLDTDTISRYHFSLAHEDDLVTISDLDSANGTFVDGIRLSANEAHPLNGGEELQIGHLRLIYHSADAHATNPMSISEDETQRYEKQDLGFRVEIYGPEIAVPPGSHTTVEISITNTHEEEQRFSVNIAGLPDGWARINRPELLVRPEDSAPVVVNIKPLRRSDSAPGDYPLRVTVASKDAPEKKIDAVINVSILPYNGFGMALAARKITAYDSFKLHVHNQGSIPLPIQVTGRSLDAKLNFEISKSQLVLGPGERQVVQGGVQPHSRTLFGVLKERPFDVLVQSQDDAHFLAATRAYYIDEPMLPGWAVFAIGGAALAVVGLLLAALLLILSVPVAPEITAFQSASNRVISGEPLYLSWTVENTETVNILVNDTLIMEGVAADYGAEIIDTTPYRGEIAVGLQAVRGERVDEASLVIIVIGALNLEYFEVVPTIPVRNVVTEMNIRWRVEGATQTRIQGLEGFTVNPIEPSFGPEGDFDVSGFATDNFAVTLVAENGEGNLLQQSINIDPIDPLCTVMQDDFTLYAAPNFNANVIGTAPQGENLIVDRRDETGAWLRTQVAGVVVWGARTGLECDQRFSPDALRIEITPTEAPATPGGGG